MYWFRRGHGAKPSDRVLNGRRRASSAAREPLALVDLFRYNERYSVFGVSRRGMLLVKPEREP
jgi:hypothetical protein